MQIIFVQAGFSFKQSCILFFTNSVDIHLSQDHLANQKSNILDMHLKDLMGTIWK